MSGKDTFTHDRVPCSGVLLTNLGTPDAPTPKALRRYLREFLWDPRVVELPRPLWWAILHGVILPLRPARSAKKYQVVWTETGSPLLSIARQQTQALAKRFEEMSLGPVKVALGMRYGNPSIAAALQELRDAGIERLLVFPLFPHYSAATTASTFDAVAAVLKTWRWLPELRMITHYHDDPHYIKAIADSIKEMWNGEEPSQRLLFSFHGLPKRNLLAGDPYHCECHKTARLVAEQLQLDPADWATSFQSRFGRAEWLKPYTSELLLEWVRAGIKRVDVVCPGFSADCLETLEEIDGENREVFLKAGGEGFRYIPALNASARHIGVLSKIIMTHTQGWPEFATDFDLERVTEARRGAQQRAKKLGAVG
jgi:ferrochelatase